MLVRPASSATCSAAPGERRRSRGPGKQPRWQRGEEMSVIVLPLVVEDDRERRRLEKLFGAMHAIKRAVQRDAAGWREELGLTRDRLERLAYGHLERSGWLLDHASKALAMHQADEVWAGVERHLFGDRRGRRSGMPRVGGWWSL